VLFDLTLAGYALSGIPQEVALIYEMLCNDPSIEPTAFFHKVSLAGGSLSRDNLHCSASTMIYNYQKIQEKGAQFKEDAECLRLRALIMGLFAAWSLFDILPRSQYRYLSRAQIQILGQSLLRIFFQGKALPQSYENILTSRFLLTRFNMSSAYFKAYLGLPPVRCRLPSDQDIIISYGVKHFEYRGVSQWVHRHVDLIPLEEPDTVGEMHWINLVHQHLRLLRKAPINRIVCVSQAVREQLLLLAPELEKKTAVIPVVVPTFKQRTPTAAFLEAIFVERNWYYTKLCDGDILRSFPPLSAAVKKLFSGGVPEFIMCTSVIEPRKNYPTLLNVWQRLRARTGRDIKLVIVGTPGWKYKKALDNFLPHVLNANLFCLGSVSRLELESLLSAARLFAFLSVNEGFGVGPVEAMQCGCPVLASGLAVHREIYGDAAEYADIHDLDSVAQKVDFLLSATDAAQSRREELKRHGFTRAQLYLPENIAPKWRQCFEDLVRENRAA